MPAKDTEDNAKDIEDKDNAKDTEMSNKTTIQGHHSPGLQTCILQLSPGLFHQGTANPANWLYSSWGICSLCEWIYVCPGFQVRSLCVILGLSLSYYIFYICKLLHMIINQFHLQICQSLLFCTFTEMLQHFTCMTHPSRYFYHCPCNPFPTSLLESSFRNTKYITPVPTCICPSLHT